MSAGRSTSSGTHPTSTRCARWTEDGLEYEADPRQAEKFIESIGLSGERLKSTVKSRLKCTKEQIDAEKELEQHEHTPYRGNGARCNYLGPDQPDIQDSAKEICRWMSSPINLGQGALKTLCWFRLVAKGPLTTEFKRIYSLGGYSLGGYCVSPH